MHKASNRNPAARSNGPKNNDRQNNPGQSPITLEAKRGSSMMVISLLPGEQILVQDYSGQDDRKKLVRHLREMGVNTETVFDSLCG